MGNLAPNLHRFTESNKLVVIKINTASYVKRNGQKEGRQEEASQDAEGETRGKAG
jgi:hypothetical protein